MGSADLKCPRREGSMNQWILRFCGRESGNKGTFGHPEFRTAWPDIKNHQNGRGSSSEWEKFNFDPDTARES